MDIRPATREAEDNTVGGFVEIAQRLVKFRKEI
jgi:hypothetical protein